MHSDSDHALVAESVEHHYGQHKALDGLELSVPRGQIFAILGPNGSGKSTLFKLVATLLRLQRGRVDVCGRSVLNQAAEVRLLLGIVFRSPSLDPKLTTEENIRCQGILYGLSRSELAVRVSEVASQLGITDRLATRTEELSGGLKRRVELAKSILRRPPVLLMDEPSTGLDPAARLDLWHALQELQQDFGATVILTTHLLEEAEKADQIAIIDSGQAVAYGKPSDLRASLGGQVLTIDTSNNSEVCKWLEQKRVEFQAVEGSLRVMASDAASLVPLIASEFGDVIHSVTLGQPSLEDVFVAKTGHTFWLSEGAGNE